LSNGLHGISLRRLQATPLAYEPLFYLSAPSLSPWQRRAKRAIDIVGSCCLLVVATPLLLVSALAIKLGDRGPVMFRQQRVGYKGLPITVYKFRTMVPEAEDQVDELRLHNERRGPLFKLETDPRRTRVGRLLEMASIDELPQLVNVLRGDMSLVGPRPALPEEVEKFDDELLARLEVRPGITGLWQVEARDNGSFQPYRRLDLFYVENWSLWLDASIMLGTVRAVLTRIVGRLVRRSAPAPAAALRPAPPVTEAGM
jgi:lipopolysaccharide/colanic/teichoic acid biosynthesis glycosyltransferase